MRAQLKNSPAPREVRGARTWATGTITLAKGIRFADMALIDGIAGVVVAPHGRLFRVLRFTLANGKMAAIEVIGDRQKLSELDLAILDR